MPLWPCCSWSTFLHVVLVKLLHLDLGIYPCQLGSGSKVPESANILREISSVWSLPFLLSTVWPLPSIMITWAPSYFPNSIPPHNFIPERTNTNLICTVWPNVFTEKNLNSHGNHEKVWIHTHTHHTHTKISSNHLKRYDDEWLFSFFGVMFPTISLF